MKFRRAPIRAITAAVTLGGVALLLVMAPLVGATTGRSWSSPYSRVAKYAFTYLTSSGCHAYSALPLAPAENLTAGSFFSWTRAVAGNCGMGATSANAQAEEGFTGFQFTASSHRATVTVSWLLTWTARTTMVGPSASYNNGSALADVIVGSVLLNAANGAYDFNYTGTANLGLFDTGIANGSMEGHGQGVTYTTNATFFVVPGTSYQMQLVADTDAIAASNLPGVLAYSQAYISGQILSVTVS